MPYIKQERRDELQPIIDLMAQKNVVADGDLNYILFYYCKNVLCQPKTYEKEHQYSYSKLKNFKAELRECADEIERKLLGPHEDKAIIRNGDI